MPVVPGSGRNRLGFSPLATPIPAATQTDVRIASTNRNSLPPNPTNAPHEDVQTAYRYSPLLGHRHIRLLRLLPDGNENAPLHSQLFDYPMLEMGDGQHMYEALSYVWGSGQRPHILHIDEKRLPITANLYEVLLRLRDKMIERILWIDAICIDQASIEERGEQIQYMAEIYSKANRVIVWLGEAADNSDQALKSIRMAADEEHQSSRNDTDHQAILAILDRPWFRRIWVLQEVAAAQHIVMMCGSIRIDGYAFCLGLPSLLQYKDIPSHIRSVTYLMRGCIFRPKYSVNSLGGISLDIRPLGALIDMYHTHEATERHDKIFALLGMSSNDPTNHGLLPNYNTPWDNLMAQLLKFILGERIFVKSWMQQQAAVVFAKGCVIGIVSSVQIAHDDSRGDRQHVRLKIRDVPGPTWTVQVAGKPIEAGDLLCHLLGAANPMVIRPRHDHFTIIMVEFIPPKEDEMERMDLERLEQPESSSLHDFLLVWDWNSSNEETTSQDYESWMTSRVSEYLSSEEESQNYPDRQTRLGNVALIMSDAGSNDKTIINTLQDMKNAHARNFGETDRRTLMCMSKLALMYGRTGHLWEAESEFWRMFWTRMSSQERREDVVRELTNFVAMCKGQGHSHRAKNFDKVASLLEMAGRYPLMADKDFAVLLAQASLRDVEVTEKSVIAAEKKFNSEAEVDQTPGRKKYTPPPMETLLLRAVNKENIEATYLLLCQEKVQITEKILISAVENDDSSVLWCLLGREKDEIRITERVVIEAAMRNNESVLQYLLERHGSKIRLTEEIVIAAAENRERSVLVYLLGRWKDRIEITPKVAVAAAENEQFPALKILLQAKGTEFEVTEEVVVAAANNREKSVLINLLEERGSEVRMSGEALDAARGNGNILALKRVLENARRMARTRGSW
ncbi:HET domain-containing protein [Trichoderma simmonsii]|uniref:HET domain-containing protein n=1 Tax=Trichoderma simmonsii TaxID=1491479 RepID=A0A8G0PEH9_9HYPO|nr:HET domain-containing protein [Trichoderma simmonsii]